MLTTLQVIDILQEIKYKNWTFHVTDDFEYMYLQVKFEAPNNVTGGIEKWGGRKWLLSEHMTKSEIVSTALKAVLTAEEHEAREQFLYRGRAIFGPHLDVDTLFEHAEEIDVRGEHHGNTTFQIS